MQEPSPTPSPEHQQPTPSGLALLKNQLWAILFMGEMQTVYLSSTHSPIPELVCDFGDKKGQDREPPLLCTSTCVHRHPLPPAANNNSQTAPA